MPPHDPVLLEYHDTVVRLSDFELLAPHQWLNDTVIEFYYEYLERRFLTRHPEVLLLRPAMAHLLAHGPAGDTGLAEALPANLHRRELIFVPVNDSTELTRIGGTHWSLLVFARADRTFYYYDTLGKYNLAAAQLAVRKLSHWTGCEASRFRTMKVAQQKSAQAGDCGVFVIMFTRCLALRYLRMRELVDSGPLRPAELHLCEVAEDTFPTATEQRLQIRALVRELQLEQVGEAIS
ncbi:hypothetical protein IWQ60_004880 [Tieghemiomyces parasiticus]|uniref:Ubiquitin-like protease family profile domain-containing protein n=1 Tax=Tieghemiomyces parasiticus TaxID=78921 RepID=A0A9W8DYR4_9FUNG|nr:hypothetical protein IWQ60_004880 [Tieghemiomyces parasiticus]